MKDSSALPDSQPAAPAADDYAAAVAEIRNHVAEHPNLDRLFADPAALEEVRGRLRRTAQSLERVMRHGAREDLEPAKRAALAVQVTLAVLDVVQRIPAESAK